MRLARDVWMNFELQSYIYFLNLFFFFELLQFMVVVCLFGISKMLNPKTLLCLSLRSPIKYFFSIV